MYNNYFGAIRCFALIMTNSSEKEIKVPQSSV